MERSREFNAIIQRFRTRSQVFGKNTRPIKKVNNQYTSNDLECFKNSVKLLVSSLNQIDIKLKQMDEYIKLLRLSDKSVDYSIIDQLGEVIRYDISSMASVFSEMNEKLKLITSNVLVSRPQSRTHYLNVSVSVQKQFQNISKHFKENCKEKELIIRNLNSFREPTPLPAAWPEPQNQQQQQVQQHQLTVTATRDNELRQRDTSVREVEATIVRLGDMFEQFSTVVQAQEELVHDIAGNTVSSLFDIEEAHSQLAKYYTVIRNQRSLILRLFAILIFLVIGFTYFL